MSYTSAFTPEAQEQQLLELYRYIAAAASPVIAERYTNAIITYCEELRTFPHRGYRRDDIREGLRVTNYRKRVVIASTSTQSRSLSSAFSTADRTMRQSCRVILTIREAAEVRAVVVGRRTTPHVLRHSGCPSMS
jgi:toxin ParE1/3/4